MALGASRRATTAMRYHRGPIRAARAIAVGAKAVIRPKPVEPPTRFYLSINRGTTGKLGLPVLPDLLVQADDDERRRLAGVRLQASRPPE